MSAPSAEPRAEARALAVGRRAARRARVRLDPGADSPRGARAHRRTADRCRGLCVAARNTDYVQCVGRECRSRRAVHRARPRGEFRAEDAAMINGTAAHGEDFDDTFEGGPVHCGRGDRAGGARGLRAFRPRRPRRAARASRGRRSHVPPEPGDAESNPQGGLSSDRVLGAMASRCGVARRWASIAKQTVDALGIAGSMAGGIIEYLAEGAWTKRLHAAGRRASGCTRRASRSRASRAAHGVRGHARFVFRLARRRDRRLRRH